MNTTDNTLKVIGSVLVAAVLWQGYMIYDLKNSIKSQDSSVDAVERKLVQGTDNLKLDPFREFQVMQQEFDKIFSRFNTIFANNVPSSKFAFDNFYYKPLLDISSNSNEYIIKTDIPGVKKSDIKIQVENNLLTIKAEVDEFKENNSTNIISKERYVQKFQRTVSIADDADTSKIKSEYKDGVLSITIPKK